MLGGGGIVEVKSGEESVVNSNHAFLLVLLLFFLLYLENGSVGREQTPPPSTDLDLFLRRSVRERVIFLFFPLSLSRSRQSCLMKVGRSSPLFTVHYWQPFLFHRAGCRGK